jgi:hypothetical protein
MTDWQPDDDLTATPQDAGRLLADLWESVRGRPPFVLRLRAAIERLREEFGDRFLAGRAGDWRIVPEVLAAFQRRVGPSMIYDESERGWRLRYQADDRDGERCP